MKINHCHRQWFIITICKTTFVHEFTHAIDYISNYFEGKLSKLGKRETDRLMEERAYGSGAKAGDLIQKQQYQDWLKRNGY